jgi:ubiquinone/menaquinone biosynthesis C-methylase UbiE
VLYATKIIPRLIRLVMKGGPFPELRAKALAPASGRVLEIGFGSGLNYPFYPSAVTSLTALEPVLENERLFAKSRAEGSLPVEFVQGVAERMPFADASFDTVVTTWTLCSVDDPAQALREMHRVLIPGGRYIFLEHGRSPDPGIARWQDRLTPIQRRLAGGCRLNRDPARLVAASPLEVERLEQFYGDGSRIAFYLYSGLAVRPTQDSAR